MIRVENLFCGYEREVVKNINLEIEKGEVLVIIGRNGCGKTTLLKTIGQLLPRIQGTIYIDDRDASELPRKEIAKKIGFFLQSRDTPHIMAQTLVEHGRFPYLGFARKLTGEDKAVVEESMKMTDCYGSKDRNLIQMSGGERQKVYLAQTIAQKTDYIFFDEPTTYLDIHIQLEIIKTIKQLKEFGKGIVVVMHDIAQAFEIADKVCILGDGEIKYYGDSSGKQLCHVIKEEFQVNIDLLKRSDGKQIMYFYREE